MNTRGLPLAWEAPDSRPPESCLLRLRFLLSVFFFIIFAISGASNLLRNLALKRDSKNDCATCRC